MFKGKNAKAAGPAPLWCRAGQSAVELAVFGAILIFILGTIVRSAVGNGYAQNQNFKAMRMAMLASWNGSKAGTMSRNSASVLFLEDRLSPDFSKYGDLDRNPYISQGAGTFSYQLEYPLDPNEVAANLPIMDIYINGQHFPFTTANYFVNHIQRPPVCPYPLGSCAQNQCLRNQREWIGGTVQLSQFYNIVPVTTLDTNTDAALAANANAIFTELTNEGFLTMPADGSLTYADVDSATLTPTFTAWFLSTFASNPQAINAQSSELSQIQSILQAGLNKYKLFYTQQVNGTPQYTVNPPACGSHPCAKDQELSSDLTLGVLNNATGDLMFDLQRLNDPTKLVPATMRPYMAWEWAATAGTTAASIGLNAANNQYPSYDIDGRLKTVIIYAISQNADGSPNVAYEDFSGGDIDGSWDTNSCGIKPGLQSDSQIYTFTQQGTYLQIKEGGLYDPETDKFVRSANKRDTIDLIQRVVQLSNDTGRFCSAGARLNTVANDGVTPNPVEVCVGLGVAQNCFSSEENIKSTCYDENDNKLFVRSRLEDLRGHYWMTDTAGQLKVQ